MSKFFNLNATDIKSALVNTVLMAIGVMMANVVAVGDISKVDYFAVINTGIIAGMTGLVTLIKDLLTNSQGKLAGIKIK